ncbi:MAG: AraD1 family protein [Pirellulales bacterium]
MRLVQYLSSDGRRLGVVDGGDVCDITSLRPGLTSTIAAFLQADAAERPLSRFLMDLMAAGSPARISYTELLSNRDERDGPLLLLPVDLDDLHHMVVTGTGLTHLGSMQSRDQMHAVAAAATSAEEEAKKSDSKKMFEMGLRGGRPPAGERGVAPEWFYKGNGHVLRASGQPLDLPDFALDGGEEPELVGCYYIDARGMPRRLGFALGNEWSDHATEKINYLYLAPSKLRTCAVGPELVLDWDFQHVELRCTVTQGGKTIYDSGPLLSGEQHMSHTLANCEDHHFKYPQHRQPGDVHLHYFGTSKLSHGTRDWQYAAGDEIKIEAPGFSAPLVNIVRVIDAGGPQPTRVQPA